jgi:hypothetical protein
MNRMAWLLKKNWLADFALFSPLLGRLRLANEEEKQRDIGGEAVVGGPSSEQPGLSILKESHNLPQESAGDGHSAEVPDTGM